MVLFAWYYFRLQPAGRCGGWQGCRGVGRREAAAWYVWATQQYHVKKRMRGPIFDLLEVIYRILLEMCFFFSQYFFRSWKTTCFYDKK
jgi:hypothetical protein